MQRPAHLQDTLPQPDQAKTARLGQHVWSFGKFEANAIIDDRQRQALDIAPHAHSDILRPRVLERVIQRFLRNTIRCQFYIGRKPTMVRSLYW